jgi:DNA (cytosine-5)-methyltransferase 1
MPDLAALSLFSGIGGIDLAAEAAGIRTVAMCEKDPFCREVLAAHWPGVPIFGDIKELRGDDFGSPIDVVHGGPPCQPVSVAGRRRGKDDERYLWGEVFRVVADAMPRFCVFENVPGILGIAGDEICSSLERLGYSVGICCFEAAAVGAPHRRMRVFFVGHAERGGLPGEPRRGAGKEFENGCEVVPNPFGVGCSPLKEPQGLSRAVGPVRHSNAFSHAARGGRGQAEPENGERAALGRAERCGGGIAEPGLGGMVDGISAALDGYWRREPDISRVARGIPNRVSRLRALGNAVVPAQIYPIFRAIAEAESETGAGR